MVQVSTIPAPASEAEALEMVLTGLSRLAAADPTAMAAQAQAECLLALEQGDAMSTAVRARFLAAFTAGRGYSADGDYSPASWLIHQTRVTRGAAREHVAWARRAGRHPRVIAALAEGTLLTESVARIICGWTSKLPAGCQDAADEILVGAALAGGRPEDLAVLAAEIYARSPRAGDDNPEPDFEDRQLRVETTFAGAGVITGDLTPECAAVVTAVLESLAAPMGAEDTRTREQRYHDALEEAMRRLAAAGLLPERAGQPVKAWAHICLAELRARDDGSLLETEGITEMRIRWAAHRAQPEGGPGGGGAWLSGDAARAVACDATITPVVTGNINPGALDDLVRLCVELDRLDHAADRPEPEAEATGTGTAPGPPGLPSRGAIRQAIIGKVADLLSGPGGLASFLRTRELGARLAGPSLPLDIGYASTIPAGIRNAVMLRDKHCRWAGGCNQPAAPSQVHHATHKADGGTP